MLFTRYKEIVVRQKVFYGSHSLSSTGLHLRCVSQQCYQVGIRCEALQMSLIEIEAFQWALLIG